MNEAEKAKMATAKSRDELISMDQEKKQTGKQPERIINETELQFEWCFGLQPEMKALKRLIMPHGFKSADEEWTFSNICLEMAEVRYGLVRKGELTQSQVPCEVLKVILNKYFPETPLPPEEYIQSFPPDIILDVGSPYAKLATLFGGRVHTIDYEFKENTENNEMRCRDQACVGLEDNGYSDLCNKLAHQPNTPPELKSILDGTARVGEQDFPREPVRGMAQIFQDIGEIRNQYSNGILPTEVALDYFRHCVGDLRNLRAQAALLADDAKPLSPFRDTRSLRKEIGETDEHFWWKEDFGEIVKSIYYAAQAIPRLEVFRAYEREVLPAIIYGHIEEIMEALYGQDGTQPLNFIFKDQLDKAVRALGLEADEWDPTTPGSRPFDVLQELITGSNVPFSDNRGLDALLTLDNGSNGVKGMVEEMNREVSSRMEAINPINPLMPEPAPVHKMLFPYTQELPSHAYDRILMSWSFTVTMLPGMPNEQIQREVWPELERLLSPDGVAVLFPIGVYNNDLYADEENQITETRMAQTLEEYNRTHPNNQLRWCYWESSDPMTEASSILVITKGHALPAPQIVQPSLHR